jgi:hypothetical protein
MASMHFTCKDRLRNGKRYDLLKRSYYHLTIMYKTILANGDYYVDKVIIKTTLTLLAGSCVFDSKTGDIISAC